MKATAVIKRPGEVKGLVKDPLSITANVSKLGGASVIVDPSLDPTSENPVENKAITEAIEEVRDSIDALDEAVHDLDDDKQDVLTFDSVPTVNSQNPVTSDGVYLGLQFVMGELQDNVTALSGQIAEKYDASNPNGYISGISGNDVKNALGYTPYNATNPNGYVNATQAASAAPVQSVNGQTGAVSLTIPTVPSNVSAFTNDAGYITGISSSDVTSALGFTPYNATNPSHYVDASGAAAAAPVQSVNGQTGAVSLTIPVVPSNVSAFTNDAGYLTLADLPIYNGGVS